MGVFAILPEEYAHLPIYDYGDSLIFPGMVDLHVHAPQYSFRGVCMDLELMDWLNSYTFPATCHRYATEFLMERAVYLGLDEKNITVKFVAGKKII